MGSGPQGRLPDLSTWLWGGGKHTKQTRFPKIRECWCRTQQCGVGACTWCSKAPLRMPGRACGRMPSLQTTESSCLPATAIALELLACFWSLVASNDPMGICKHLPPWASTGTAGRPPSPGCFCAARLCCWSCEQIYNCCRAGTEGGL